MPSWSTKLSDRALDAATLAFALWTIACNATVVAGGDGRALMVTGGLVFAIAAAGLWAWRQRTGSLFVGGAVSDAPMGGAVSDAPMGGAVSDAPMGGAVSDAPMGGAVSDAPMGGAVSDAPMGAALGSEPRWMSALGLVLALGVLAAWSYSRDGLWIWSVSCVFFIGSTAWLLFRPPLHAPAVVFAEPNQVQEAALWLLAGFSALCTLWLHLPNTDDVLYVNMAVALADHPEYKLFAHDTIHGAEEIMLAAYSVHSFELLGGVISFVTRIPALLVIHLGLATFAALLTPLAWARLFRLLDPWRWLWMVAIVVSLYLFDGTDMRSFSMHGFVRIFQGKAILLSVGVPLITANGLLFARAPSRRGFVLLAASVISGVGLSSTGLWLSPLIAGTALLVGAAPRMSSLVAAAVGLISCAYPVALGLWVKSLMAARRVGAASAAAAASDNPGVFSAEHLERSFAIIGKGIAITFGGRQIACAYLACLFLAWPLARTELARRYIVVFCAIGAALLFNPFLLKFVQANVTGAGTYSRVLWYLPIPAALALCFSSMLPSDGSLQGKAASFLISCLALAGFYAVVPKTTVFAAGNFAVSLMPKVEPTAYEIAKYLARVLPAESSVLGPRQVSLHVPLIQHHPYPVMTKTGLVKKDRGPRLALRKVIDGDPQPIEGKHRGWFIGGLKHYHVTGVVLAPWTKARGLDTTLRRAGYTLVLTLDDFQVWTKDAPRAD